MWKSLPVIPLAAMMLLPAAPARPRAESNAAAYALVVLHPDRGPGRDLKRSSLDCSAVTQPPQVLAMAVVFDAQPLCGITISGRRIRASGLSMARFADALTTHVQQSVVDETGLTGFFDFDIDYRPRGQHGDAPTSAIDAQAIRTALEEHLGLTLKR